MDFIIFKQLGIAVALASMIGLEREKKRQLYKRDTFGGLRTFMLIGLSGALSYILAGISMAFFIVMSSGFLALMIAIYIMSARKEDKNVGVTSEIAAILVYVIGILSAMNQFILAITIALAILLILYFKEPLHKLAHHLQKREIISTVEFVLIAFIILPLLPNQGYGLYDFFNPYLVWLMVVFISGLSFLSYIAIRIFGTKKGIFLTGFLAGFISSTALALTYSAESKKQKKVIYPFVIAVIIASTAMFFRVLVEVAVVNSDILARLFIPMLSMGVAGILMILFFWLVKEERPEVKALESEKLDLPSPFSLIPALKFGIFFVAILFLANLANDLLGNKGLYLTSFISGILDVDAITLSIANLTRDGLSQSSGVVAITIGAISNTFFKAMIFVFWGGRQAALRILGAFLAIIAIGLISLLFV